MSAGAGVVDESTMARGVEGVVAPAAAPVEPAAAAAGDWIDVAWRVVVSSGACQGSKPSGSAGGPSELAGHQDRSAAEGARRD